MRYLPALVLAIALTVTSMPGLGSTTASDEKIDDAETSAYVKRITTLNVEQLAADATTGQVSIDLGGAAPRLDLSLERHEMQEPGHHGVLVHPDGTQTVVETGFLGTYIGTLDGFPQALVRATITSGYANILVDDAALGIISIESLPADPMDAPGQRRAEVSFLPPQTDDSESTAAAKTDPGTADPLIGSVDDYTTIPIEENNNLAVLTGWETPTTTLSFSIRLDSDGEYYNADSANIWSRQIAIVNNAEGMYNTQVKIAWTVSAQYTFTSAGGPTTKTNVCSTSQDLLDDFRDYWQTNRPTSTFPRAFVAIASQRNFSGSDIGCAYTPGLHNAGTSGYAIIQAYNYGSAEEREIMQHELGHTFNGRHEYAKKWWSWSCFCYKKTIMIDSGLGALQKFSEGDDYAFNSYRVRKCAESPGTCNSMPLPAAKKNAAIFL